MMFAPSARGADALTYFKNYFVTGDYTVAGVGLRGTGAGGFATGNININGVPCTKGVGDAGAYVPCSVSGAVPADVVAAFLYWETEESTTSPAAINGFFDGNAIVGKNLGNVNNPACWNSENGATPNAWGRVYRADVLRYLKIDSVNSVRVANGTHSVKLPEQGIHVPGAGVLLTDGATLVVVYRVIVPGEPQFAPFKSVVLYDGAYTMTSRTAAMTQTVGGFYQATGEIARMTQIVANGQSNFSATLVADQKVIAQHVFTGTAGGRWDNPTFPLDLDRDDSSFTTAVNSVSNSTCLTWAAIVSSTPVVDSDRDGLLDVWETKGLHLNPGTAVTPATFGGCADYPSDTCVNLPAMGAKANKQDIFVQIDWTHGRGDLTGGTDGSGNHVHMPKAAALAMVCSRFAGPLHNVALHFDVGNNYQGQPCIVPYRDNSGKLLAQGGSDIDEAALLCPNAITAVCSYSKQYPVLSYKRTFLGVKNGYPVLNIPQHFDHNRKDLFHYALWSHSVGGPFDLTTGKPLTTDPKSISGVADRPGADLMITLGLWRSDIPANDQVGSVLVQAGTLMHELGHNLDLSHAGLFRTPNCMPNYSSVMNYLYQTRGLTDASGNEQIDYSYGIEFPLNESSLSSPQLLGFLNYRVRYFGPIGAGQTPGQASQVHCDGTTITNGALAVRSEGPVLSTPIGPIAVTPDWSNGTLKQPYARFQFDVNFNGIVPETFYDQPDWSSLNLQQIGARPNVNGLSADIHLGAADLGAADLGAADLGAADLGAADLGAADLGAADLGAADLGAADLGAADLGAADLGDEDYDTHVLTSPDPPPSPSPGCPAPQCGLLATSEISDVLLQWAPPDIGKVTQYNVYRCAVIAPATSCTPIGPARNPPLPMGTTTPNYTDTVNDMVHAGATCPATATCYNTPYTYFVTATVNAGGKSVESGPTNTATGRVTHLFVIADNQTATYGSAIPTPTYKVYGDIAGSLTSGVICSYPVTPRNVGSYAIACNGPLTTSATDGVTYKGDYLTFTPGTLTITPAPLTINPGNASRTVGGPNPVFPFSYRGLVPGDVTIATPPTCTTTTPLSAGPGTYNTITCTGAASPNYSPITYGPNGILTVHAPTLVNFPSLVLNGAGAAVINGTPGPTLRLSDNIHETTSAWLSTQQAVTSGFSTSFSFKITPLPGLLTLADGFAFVIQSSSSGSGTLGTTGMGGYLGYTGIPNSIAIEFDTFQNSWDASAPTPHIGIQSFGIAANSPDHTTAANLGGPHSVPFADGNMHTATINYDGSTLSVLLDGSTVATATVNLGTLLGSTSGNAFVGFTAATGDSAEFSDILSWNWN